MEYIDIIEITPEEFFNAIEYSLLIDIKNATGKEIDKSEIQRGFHWQKDIRTNRGGTVNSKVLIEEYQRPSIYQVKFEAGTESTTMKYLITPMDDDACKVVYSEDYVSTRKMSKLNYMVVSFFMKRNGKKKIKQTLKAIYDYTLSVRNENSEEQEAN